MNNAFFQMIEKDEIAAIVHDVLPGASAGGDDPGRDLDV
jgi:hypothetical protein